jgi:hypothetical protein
VRVISKTEYRPRRKKIRSSVTCEKRSTCSHRRLNDGGRPSMTENH